MRNISVFNYVSLDGFFCGPNGEMDFFKTIKKDDEFNKFTRENAKSGGILIFGRKTYDIMKSWWPTDAAVKADPIMAAAVNNSEKIVFSKKQKSLEPVASWKNVKLYNDIKADEIMALKKLDNRGMTILGSGSVVQQLSNIGMIDEYVILIVPIILGSGKPMFQGVSQKKLKLAESRTFKNGIIWLKYRPVK